MVCHCKIKIITWLDKIESGLKASLFDLQYTNSDTSQSHLSRETLGAVFFTAQVTLACVCSS